ncbi:HAD family hydrolase [Streptomyces sp. PTM05]|uniref:HAD family hydrolase n=1 Tax=Streptantibioticus parmotrematis TaxID=2873249 RepID=A0ABS7QK12_9ACTN|nr:HAD family hydrolase [Streptantibioticus parmotrematis]MBY8883506.1 HAD family hydrolase [Streptantibioticus parmotrematis]
MAGRDASRAVLFDVDGTLMDTVYLHTVAWWEALRQNGHDVPTSAIHRAIGMGSDHLLAHLLGPGRDTARDDDISAAHGVLYGQYWSRLAPLDGASDLLRACADRGWSVVLASSAKPAEFQVMRDALDADDVIDAVTKSDDVEAGKPAPDLVERALERADVPARHAVFVGDAVWDAQAAGRAGVRCLGVLSGGFPRQDLLDAGAEEVYDGPRDLLTHLEDSLLGKPSALGD